MITILGRLAALSALIAIASATELRAGYVPYVYHQHDHYHRHDHFHYLVPSPGWYYVDPPAYVYPPAYSLEYGYSPRPRYFKTKKKRTVKRDPNWYYCKSYWRQPAYMEEGPRFWWPYFNPRPVRAATEPVPDKVTKIYTAKAWTPGAGDPCNHKNKVLKAPGSRPY